MYIYHYVQFRDSCLVCAVVFARWCYKNHINDNDDNDNNNNNNKNDKENDNNSSNYKLI